MFKRPLLTVRSLPTLPDLDRIARETGLVQRESTKFTPAAFLQTLMSSVTTGLASFNKLVGGLADRLGPSMARQSLHQRINERSTSFLVTVLNDLLEQRYRPVAPALSGSPVRRIIIEDSTSQNMPKANAANFPAHGNHHGATAGVKIDFAYDLLTGTAVSHSLHLATEQDKTIGRELITLLVPGDLVLRDMGYFVTSEFTVIEERGAFWLSRLPLTTGLHLENGKAIEHLLDRTRKHALDLLVFIGEERKTCRLVARRAAPELAEDRRAARRAKARSHGGKPNPQGIIRDGWHILLTNLTTEQASISALMAVYRARWAVEIQFRAWKQSHNLGKALNRRSSDAHMQALVLAAMIAQQLVLKIAARLSEEIGRARLSCEMLHDQLADRMVKAATPDELLAFAPDPRHVSRDKRKRQSPVESGLQALN